MDVRHLVEIDCGPDELAFVLRCLGRRAEKWSIRRMGAVQSMYLISGLSTGLHWTGLDAEIMAADATGKAATIYRRQFAGARSLRILRVCGTAADPALVEAYRPDAVFADADDYLPSGLRRTKSPVGRDGCVVGYASVDAEEIVTSLLRRTCDSLSAAAAGIRREFEVSDLVLWDGLYQVEGDGTARWAWTGGRRTARFFVPGVGRRPQRLSLFAYGTAVAIDERAIGVLVNGEKVPCRYLPDEMRIDADLPGGAASHAHLVELHHDRLAPTADGSRELGFALKTVRVEVI